MENLFPKIGTSKTLSKEIEENIEELIVGKKLVAGQKLPTEKELCEMFGVSRTALREALQMLNARGLISVRKGSGIYVNEFSYLTATKATRMFLEMNFDQNYIMHIIEVRQMIEPQITRLAARNRSEEDIQILKETIDKLSHAADVQDEGAYDRDFHIRIAAASGNPVIPLMVNPIFRLMPRIRAVVYEQIDTAKSAALSSHQEIYRMIVSQDEQGAEKAMREHLRIAEEHSRLIRQKLGE